VEIARPEQPDQAVAQILALQEDENDDDQNDAGGRQRMDDRGQKVSREREGRQRGLANLDGGRPLIGRRPGRGGGGRVLGGFLDLAVEPTHDVRQTPDGALAQGGDLLPDGGLVERDVAGELRHLQSNHAAERQENAERHQHGDDHRRHPGEMQPAQQADERREDEAEQDREDDRNENLAPEIQGGDRDRRDGQRHQAGDARRLGGGDGRLWRLGG
jgi:hypothetical protein